MKILFFGDSITDMGRNRDHDPLLNNFSSLLGTGFPYCIAGDLSRGNPHEYKVINVGCGGDRIVDLYARVKKDVWNYEPDVITILIGTNDVWHELYTHPNGVDIRRYDRIYRMLIEDTLKVLPNVKIIIMGSFLLDGSDTHDHWDYLVSIKDYALIAQKIAKDYNLPFVELQEVFDKQAEKYGSEVYLGDGIHPTAAGARLIADEWIKVFNREVLNK
mgnify:FL=1